MSDHGEKFYYAAGILIIVGFPIFVFAPILTYNTPVIGDTYFRAQVSPSYYLLKCGMTYGLATVYTENGQVVNDHVGARWLCG